jgi:hypothetical protein
MSTAIALREASNAMASDPYKPTNMEQAMSLAKLVASSDLAPKDYRGKPANVFVAMQMGHELGLSPMQSIQNIAVINGRPSVWGDALLALCQAHPSFEDIQETDDGDTATCLIKRRGRSPVSRSFSMDDAKRAGLLGKQGPWSSYPARMRQMRARGFALRDAFADALRGLSSAEEQEDVVRAEVIAPVEVAPQASEPAKTAVEKTKETLRAKKHESLAKVLDRIANASTLDDLGLIGEAARHLSDDDKPKAREAFAKRKAELEFMDEQPHDAATGELFEGREPGADDDRDPAGTG